LRVFSDSIWQGFQCVYSKGYGFLQSFIITLEFTQSTKELNRLGQLSKSFRFTLLFALFSDSIWQGFQHVYSKNYRFALLFVLFSGLFNRSFQELLSWQVQVGKAMFRKSPKEKFQLLSLSETKTIGKT
jgi:hypothetical protein